MPKRKGKESVKQREYRLLMSRIKSAEKAGYRFTDDFKKSLIHRSVKTLHNMRGIRLVREGFYLVTPEQAVSGASGYYLRQQQAIIQSAKTRKHKKSLFDLGGGTRGYGPQETEYGSNALLEFIDTFKPQWGVGRQAKQWNKMEAARDEAHRTVKYIYDVRVDEIGISGILQAVKQSNVDIGEALNAILYESDTETIKNYGIKLANAMNGGVISQADNKKISEAQYEEFDRTSSIYEGQYRNIYEGRRHEKKAVVKSK